MKRVLLRVKNKKNCFQRFSLFIIVISLFASCSSSKKIEKRLFSGDYDQAIKLSISKLKSGRDNPKNQKYVLLLEESYEKAQSRDLKKINDLRAEKNSALRAEMYDIYQGINARQEFVSPILPLFVIDENRPAKFKMWDFSKEITEAKSEMCQYYYQRANEVLKADRLTKMEYRRAYDDLAYLLRENPGYKNAEELKRKLHTLGINFIHVYTRNDTKMIIPKALEAALLDFSTWGLNDKWTVFHNKKNSSVNYDFAVLVSFREITISPDNVREKEFVVDREVVVEERTKKDSNGKVMLDSSGKPIKEKIYKKVKADVFETRQFKSCRVQAKVDYLDLQSKQTIDTYPLDGAFQFENIFIRFSGDKRALDKNYTTLSRGSAMPFPSNEQMVFDCGENLKKNLKNIVSKMNFSARNNY